MDKRIKLDSRYEFTDEVINNNFHKVKLYIQHDGLNHNGTVFEKENIEKATKTLANIPILAYIKRGEHDDAYDLGGHEVELRLEEKDGELYFREHYLEQAVGVIGETNGAHFEEIDGRTYLVAYGYIWKSYSNEFYDIMLKNEQMSVSMEIEVKSMSFKDDYIDITDYEFTGVTVLGSDVPPAMDGACINMNFSKDNTFINNVKELNSYLNKEFNGKEDKIVEEVKNAEETIENEGQEEVTENYEQEIVENDEYTENPETIEDNEDVVEDEIKEGVEVVIDGVTYSKEDIIEKFNRLQELETFKAEYDAKVELEEVTNQVNEVVEKFDFKEDEISELKEKAINKEFTIETFELHLEALYGRKVREQKNEKKNFSKEPEKLTVSNPVVEKEDERKLYFEELKKKYL